MDPLIHRVQYERRAAVGPRSGTVRESWSNHGPPVPCAFREMRPRPVEESGQERSARVIRLTHAWVTGLKPRQTRAVVTLSSGRVLRTASLLGFRDAGPLPGRFMECELETLNPGSEAS